MATVQPTKNRRATIAFGLGAGAAAIWALVDYANYSAVVGGSLWSEPWLNPVGDHGVSLRFIVNELFMVPLFGIVMRDLWQSSIEGGPFATVRKAGMPLVAAVAAVVVPIVLSFALRDAAGYPVALAESAALAVPTGVVYAWIFARIGPGRRHPAAIFLVATVLFADLISTLIVAAFHMPEMEAMWLGLVVLAMAFCDGFRRFNVQSFWPYMLVGAPLSWIGLQNAGLHAAFALVPLIPFMSLDSTDDGEDALTKFERFLSPIVDLGVLVFALANIGFLFTFATADDPALVWDVVSVVGGTAVGVWLFSFVARTLGLQLTDRMTIARVALLGLLAGIGFGVASLVSVLAAS